MSLAAALMPTLVLQAPGIPEPVVERALAETARGFFLETEAWTPRPERFITFSGVNEFEIPLPQGARIARVHWVRVGRSQELAALDYEAIPADTGRGYFVDNETHQLYLTTATPRGWTEVFAACYPTLTTCTLPAHLLEDFGSTLVNLTLARLYGMVGVAWSNPEQGLYLAATAQQVVLRAKRLSNNRRAGGRKTVRYGGIR